MPSVYHCYYMLSYNLIKVTMRPVYSLEAMSLLGVASGVCSCRSDLPLTVRLSTPEEPYILSYSLHCT